LVGLGGGVSGVLTKDERREVEEEFAIVVAGHPDGLGLVTVIFKAEAQKVLLELRLQSASPDEFASLVVGYSLTSRWSCDPALLDLLLDYLINTKGRGEFETLLTRVRKREDPNPSPYDAAWLVTQRPFFDRADLRAHVRSLVEENTRPVLRVTPSPESYGRSYSRQFLEHLEEMSPGDTHIVSEELSPGTGPSYQAIDLADAVRAQLGVIDDLPTRSGSSYPKTVARWVLGHIMSKGDRWVIVLDGFGQPGLNPEVRETIEALAAMIPGGQYRRRVRLVLLDYPENLPSVGPADMLEEVLNPPANLTQADLEPCIVEWDAQRRKQGGMGLPPEQIHELAARMIARAPASGKERLEFFNQNLIDLTRYA
jgi:hypothetical protein